MGTTWAATTARADEDSPVRAELAALLRHPVRAAPGPDRRRAAVYRDRRAIRPSTELRAWVERERPGSRVDVDADIIRCAFDAADAVS